jgi:hypothetical protein
MAYLLDWTSFWRKKWTNDNWGIMFGGDSLNTIAMNFLYEQWIHQTRWTNNTTTYGAVIPEGFHLDTDQYSVIDTKTGSSLLENSNRRAMTNSYGYGLWLRAIYGNTHAKQDLQEHFNINSTQIAPLLIWLYNFEQIYVDLDNRVINDIYYEPYEQWEVVNSRGSIPGFKYFLLLGVLAVSCQFKLIQRKKDVGCKEKNFVSYLNLNA